MLFGKLLPREGNFFELFNQHGNPHRRGRARLHPPDPALRRSRSLRDKHTGEVGTAERQADRITAEVHRLLHKTFVTPIDREQIHGLINAMDDVLDLLQDASETMSLYDVQAMNEDILRLGDMSARCCERVQHAISLLPEDQRARGRPGGAQDLRGDRPARVRRRPGDALGDVAPVPRGEGRARADQAEGGLRAARVDLRSAARTSPT
jgi:uncharacterized protein Yka (UPF0111/DUF47 family)